MVRRFPALHGEAISLSPAIPWDRIVCHPDRLDKPLHWRKPRVVLVSMLGDLFHEQVPVAFQLDVLAAMREAQQHQYCVLTKRPDTAAEFFSRRATMDLPRRLILMASVWDQPSTDAACEGLSRLPAGIRWGLHCEPCLSAIDIVRACIDATPANHARALWPAWIVCGAEQGPGARPFNLEWARSLRDQCASAGVPFWFKAGSRRSEPPSDLDVRQRP